MQSLVQQNRQTGANLDTVLDAASFVERRGPSETRPVAPERRQFKSTQDSSRPAVVELAAAVDAYKARHRRRFITFDELYDVMADLGYQK